MEERRDGRKGRRKRKEKKKKKKKKREEEKEKEEKVEITTNRKNRRIDTSEYQLFFSFVLSPVLIIISLLRCLCKKRRQEECV